MVPGRPDHRDDVVYAARPQHPDRLPPPAAGPVHLVGGPPIGIHHHGIDPEGVSCSVEEGRDRRVGWSGGHVADATGRPYAAGMVALPDSARALLDGPHLAHVVTLDPDGAPQVSCVWVRTDGDDIVFASLGPFRKIRNLERDERVALSIESPETNDLGMRQYLVATGTARIEPGGAPELLQELAHLYVGPDVRFPPVDDPPPGSIVRITVDRITGVGPWTG